MRSPTIVVSFASLLLFGCPRPGIAPLSEQDLANGPLVPIAFGPPASTEKVLRFTTHEDSGEDLVFVDVRPAPERCRPAVLFRSDGETRQELMLIGGDMEGAGWAYVGSLIRARALVAVVDRCTGPDRPQLLVLASPDAGRRWFLRGRLDKVHPKARFHRLVLDTSGRGRLIMVLDPAPGVAHPPGRYVAHTEDAGATWTTPEPE